MRSSSGPSRSSRSQWTRPITTSASSPPRPNLNRRGDVPPVGRARRSLRAAYPPDLSRRLRLLAGLVPAGVSVADIGAGDGKLAAWLAADGHAVIATENKPGPLAEVRRRLDPLGVECRLGEGLLPLARGEVQVAVIAGMGGRTIASILAASPALVGRLEALVLQPVQHLAELREELDRSGLRVEAEAAVEQGRHRYVALRVLPAYSTGS